MSYKGAFRLGSFSYSLRIKINSQLVQEKVSVYQLGAPYTEVSEIDVEITKNA